MGVMAEPLDLCDMCDQDASESVDLYASDATSMVDTIDIETETWPTDSPLVSDETIIVADQVESILTGRLETLAHDLETRLTRLVQSLVHSAVQEAGIVQGRVAIGQDREECPVARKTGATAEGRSTSLRVRIDSNLFELFDAECRLRYHGNAYQAMNAILWQHYGKPRLSFESGSTNVRKKRLRD